MKGRRFAKAAAMSVFCLSAAAFTGVSAVDAALPDRFFADDPGNFCLSAYGELSLRPAEAVSPTADLTGSGTYTVCLPGGIPVKEVVVEQENRRYVIPSGEAFGIRLYSDGVMVVGLQELSAGGQTCCPAYQAGLRPGDIITAVNGQKVTENSQVNRAVSASGGQTVTLSFTRSRRTYTASLTPVSTETGYKAGMWVRDSVAGIGTLTYFDTDSGTFAGLGHGIADADSGERYPIGAGSAVHAAVPSVVKGECGKPGELKGYFEETDVGRLTANTETGVYGFTEGAVTDGSPLPVAFRQEVKKGPVTLLCEVNGEGVAAYGAEIEEVRYNPSRKTRNLVVRITDPRLLMQTGGIVQGMSGSPIIQDGKLVGAVTHVFVDDPSRGYGIFAENMLETARNIEQLKQAS